MHACEAGKDGGEVAEFEAKVKETIRAKGPMSIAQLGSAVKRPAGVPKLKKFLDDSKAFKLDANMTVSLA
jgi:hypothetical protein